MLVIANVRLTWDFKKTGLDLKLDLQKSGPVKALCWPQVKHKPALQGGENTFKVMVQGEILQSGKENKCMFFEYLR